MVQISAPQIDKNKFIAVKMFIANKIVPIAIQRDKENNTIYKILFGMIQDMDENMIYFETRIKAEDSVDIEYIENRPIYIDEISKSKEKKEAYNSLMKEFNPDKFYIGDLLFKKNDTGNHIINAFKKLINKNGNDFYELTTIHIPRYMYIILSLFIENIMEPYSDIENIESLFINPDMKSIRFEKVEGVKLIATCKSNRDDLISYNSHYEMNCGPKTWKFNYEILMVEDNELKIPLDKSIFDPEYSLYNDKFIGLVKDSDCCYIIIYDDNHKIKGLRISRELLKLTNIDNPYFIFKDIKTSNKDTEESEETIEISSSDLIDENGNTNVIETEKSILIPMDKKYSFKKLEL